MKKIIFLFFIFSIILATSCGTSNAVYSYNANMPKYEYVVFGNDITGDRSLDDIVLQVENAISSTSLRVVSSEKALELILQDKGVLTPHISVSSEKWDGGHTYITINFFDYKTDKSVLVVKSSGIGLTVSHDQSIALNYIKLKLQEIFY